MRFRYPMKFHSKRRNDTTRSLATALHALNKARFKGGESIAIFGFGGLGFSALQLARAFDCEDIYVVDINAAKLALAASMGAIAIDARSADPVEQIKEATAGRGVDVALELIGSAKTMRQAVPPWALWTRRSCRINGRIDVGSSVH